MLDYPGGDLGPGTELELVQDVGDVVLDGALCYRELGCYAAVGEALPDESGHLPHAAGENCLLRLCRAFDSGVARSIGQRVPDGLS